MEKIETTNYILLADDIHLNRAYNDYNFVVAIVAHCRNGLDFTISIYDRAGTVPIDSLRSNAIYYIEDYVLKYI